MHCSRRSNRHSSARLRLEQLEARNLLAVVGDAPDPYPAASVAVQTGPVLGDLRTTDDGVLFAPVRVGQLNAEVTIEVSNVPVAGALLDAWIDFDGDGSFSGAHEQVFDALPVTNGIHVLSFDVPSTAADGSTYARFRISQSSPGGGLAQGGAATNGEVEDHQVVIHPPSAADVDFNPRRDITSNGTADGVVDVMTVDIDQDGRMDLVSSSQGDGEIAVYRSNANFTSWTRTVVGEVAGSGSQSEVFAVGLAAGDLDADGDTDLASASAFDGTVAWYRNDSVGSNLSFTKFEITGNAGGARAVVIADFNRDGRLDLASAALADDVLLVHRNTGSANGASLFDTVTAVDFLSGNLVADLYSVDVNRDGWNDLVSITAGSNRITWHENDGTPFSGGWGSATTVFNGADAVNEARGSGAFAGDIDEDGDIDIVGTSFEENRVDWFRSSSFGDSWSGSIAIGTGIDGANPPFVADIDGDGYLDVLTPGYVDDAITLHLNNGAGNFAFGGSSDFFSSPTNVAVGDINGDGTLDIVAGGFLNDRISWWDSVAIPPEIAVTGNGITITDGDTSPSLTDGTNFGAVPLGSSAVVQTFTIHNSGVGSLTVGPVTAPTGFTVVSQPAAFIPPGESTEFAIGFQPNTLGARSGQVTFANSDLNENPFNFNVRATVITMPGDYNLDSVVDAADYTVWRDTLGSTLPTFSGADGNGDGIVTAADYSVWKSNYGDVYVPPVATVAPQQAPHGDVSPRLSLPGLRTTTTIAQADGIVAATPMGDEGADGWLQQRSQLLLLLDAAFTDYDSDNGESRNLYSTRPPRDAQEHDVAQMRLTVPDSETASHHALESLRSEHLRNAPSRR